MNETRITKQTIKVGNSAGVLLPKDWLGNEVVITLKREPHNIKKDVLKLLDPHLKKVIGVYIVGSYARGESTPNSDIDILIVSTVTIRLTKFRNYHFISTNIDEVRSALQNNPILIYPMIIEAKPILNEYLLEEFKKYKIKISRFKWFIETSKSSLNVDKEFLNIEKIEGNKIFKSPAVIYSLVLRLRGAYILGCILKNKTYFNKDLIKFMNKILGKGLSSEMYKVYRAIRDKKKILKYKITLEDTEKLYKLVRNMIEKEEKLI